MFEDSQKKNQVIFFFGAGASVDAGIPDTYAFTCAFEEYIQSKYPQLYQPLSIILEKRKKYNENNQLKPEVDVEQLLDTLRRLLNRDKEPLLDFYEEKRFCSNLEQNSCLELRTLLENFIRDRVVVKDNGKLDYLRKLLDFDIPLEIYSTNYDTCIEQLTYLSHRRYSDGFNVDWNEKNFEGNYDIKHYKLHGSVIWFENVKTKQCVKIPAQAFFQGDPVELKLIYGEDIEPLLLYPAQKVEYIEPLSDLQLMFKNRLLDKKTEVVIFVGYSFKDEYVTRMLWDAARVNENLHVILISPNANSIFETKLKYINKENKDLSRIQDKVLCLPYPFATVIYQLRNHYLMKLSSIRNMENQVIEKEKYEDKNDIEWQNLLRLCIEGEFSSKAEYILEEKLCKDWNELVFDVNVNKFSLAFQGLMHSIIAKDDYTDRWLRRLNDTLEILKTENLQIHSTEQDFRIFVHHGSDYSIKELLNIIESLLSEKTKKLRMLSPSYENSLNCLGTSFKKLEKLKDYFDTMKEKHIKWQDYLTLRNDIPEKIEINELSSKLCIPMAQNIKGLQTPKKSLDSLILTIERRELDKIYGGQAFQFRLEETKT